MAALCSDKFIGIGDRIANNISRRAFLGKIAGSASLIGVGSLAHTATLRAAKIGVLRVLPDYNQPLRPQFHFTSGTGWINDPNGLVYVDGIYHMFFQHNPLGNVWGHMTWGHAISPDLVHWRQLADAIRPDSLGTIFSGSAAIDTFNTAGFGTGTNPPVIAMYTAAGGTSKASEGRPFTQCLAYSNDGGLTFTKYKNNPVLKEIVPGNRDPKIIWYAPTRRWIMPLFLEASHGFDLFSSPDLKHWTKFQNLSFPQSQECPNFFPLPVEGKPGSHRWIFTGANSQYIVGQFNGHHFTPESGPFPMDNGRNFYAAQVYNNIPASDGRTIQIGWMRGGSYPGMPFNQQMSFPCTLKLRAFPAGLRICREPVREIQSLWSHVHRIGRVALADQRREFPDLIGNQLDIEATLHPGTARLIGMEVCGQKIEIHTATRRISALGATGQMEKPAHANDPVRLRILVDRTSIEVFAPDAAASLSSCYIPLAGQSPFAIYAHGGNAIFTSLVMREITSAWKGE